jgi:rare lipoprotein A
MRASLISFLLLLALFGCAGTSHVVGEVGGTVRSLMGIASYYGHQFHGRTTANGEIYDENLLTAAHRTLPFGTRVRVTNLTNGEVVRLRINDRGPFVDGRIIDVSWRAAQELDFVQQGLVRVRVDVLSAE